MTKAEFDIPNVGDIDPRTVRMETIPPGLQGDGNYWTVLGNRRSDEKEYYYSYPVTSAIIYHLRGNQQIINGETFSATTYKGGLDELDATMQDVFDATVAVNEYSKKNDEVYGYVREFVLGPQVERHNFYLGGKDPAISINLHNLGLWEPVELPLIETPQNDIATK